MDLPSCARATRPPLHRGDLEKGRPRKIISSETEKIRVKRHHILQKYRYKQIVKLRRAMVQWSPGYDHPYEPGEIDAPWGQ